MAATAKPLRTTGRSRHSVREACRPRGALGTPNARQSDEALFHRYHCLDDLTAREELVQRFLPLARRLARRYCGGGEALEDLVQVADLGLIKAIDRFDSTRGSRFASYAVPTILGELKRYFRDSGWALHVPRSMQERVQRVNHAVGTLSAELGCLPTAQQVAGVADLSTEDVLEGLEAAAAYHTNSLEAPIEFRDGGRSTYADMVGEEDARFEIVEETAALSGGLRALPEQERVILWLRFGAGFSQAEIGQRIGISQMHVSRLLRRALDRLHAIATNTPQPVP